MTMNLLDAHIFDSEVGHFVSETHRLVAEVIRDYEPTLQLVWIPPEKRSFDDNQPFALLHSPIGQTPYIVRKMRPEEVNVDLIAWLWSNDQARNARDLHGYLKARDDAEKAIMIKRHREQMDEANDVATHIIGGKNWYKHGGKVFS
jgi:hypothetical protein